MIAPMLLTPAVVGVMLGKQASAADSFLVPFPLMRTSYNSSKGLFEAERDCVPGPLRLAGVDCGALDVKAVFDAVLPSMIICIAWNTVMAGGRTQREAKAASSFFRASSICSGFRGC